MALYNGDDTNNTLNGSAGADEIYGLGGADTLSGMDGNDYLDGGSGNDSLYGGLGDDTYVFGAGSGNDIINEAGGSSGGNDQILLSGLNQADVSFQKSGPWNLILTLKSTGETLTVYNAFSPTTSINVESYNFADGALTLAQINTLISTGGAGNDLLYGWTGDDTLTGNAGSDTLYGLGGNDTLDGGSGNDTLHGGAGDDTYVFGIGSGNDTIDEYDAFTGYSGNDQVLLSGLNQADVTIQRNNATDLTLTIKSTGEKLLVQNAFSALTSGATGPNNVETYSFADGTLTLAQINTLLSTGGVGNDILYGWIGNDTLTGNAGSDSLYGLYGNDLLDGGSNADKLYGGMGDDTYVFGVGSGNDTIVESDNSGAGGNDQVLLSGLNQADVTFQRPNYSDLTLTINATGEKLYIQNAFELSTGYNVETYSFADGSLTLAQINTLLGTGTAGNDTLYGWTTNDTLTGNAGDDLLKGLQGNDILNGGTGNDTLYGAAGDDTYVFGAGSGNDTIYEWDSSGAGGYGGGNDQVLLSGLNKADVSFQRPNASDLVLTVNATGEKLLIRDAFSSSTAYNVETYRFADGALTLAQINTLLGTGGTGNDKIYGWIGNDILTGNAGDDLLSGLQGNDVLNGGAGTDTLYGGAGDDTYVLGVGSGNDTIGEYDSYSNAGSIGGNDRVQFNNVALTDMAGITRSGYDLIIAYGSGNQVAVKDYFSSSSYQIEQFQFAGGNTLTQFIIGTAANNTLVGGATSDALVGLAGADSLSGGAGNDLYVVDDAGDVITEAAGAGTDTVLAAINLTLAGNVENLGLLAGALTGTGNSLNNALTGNAANNVLNGGLGNDVLNGRAGADTLIGGDGNDTYVVDQAGDVVTETNAGTTQIDWVQSYLANYTLGANVENLQLLGAGPLNGTGNSLNNALYANAGNNVLDGGAGLDTVSYQYGATQGVTVSLAITAPQATGGSGSDTLVNIENLVGSNYADTLTGNAANNILNGWGGADTLTGGDGNDVYVVDHAGDVVTETNASATQIDTVQSSITYTLGANLENLILTGAAAINAAGNTLNNSLTGNGAANVLDGGLGNDWLKGGAGADTFVFGTLGVDRVLDFLSGTDQLRFLDGATGLKIGDGDHLIDNATLANAPGAFSNAAELVVVTPNIAGTLTAASAAAAIGSASAAYALGDTRLFAVDNGADSALYRFQAIDADAAVEAHELTLVGILQGTAQTALADYAFA